ncbi:MAG: hypothetical protein KKC77_19415 [Proteobacteria bacterium]|nr:hypothetical protein [Pseudomonadota bacterium]
MKRLNNKQLGRIAGMSGAIISIYLFSIGNKIGGLIVLGISLIFLLWKFKNKGWFF